MGQLAKLKRTWNLVPVLQIVQNIIEIITLAWIYQLDWPSLATSWVLVQNIYSEMHLVSSANTYCDVTDLVNHEMFKNTKTWISWERNIIFLRNKNVLNLCFRQHILGSYRFVVEVTLKLDVWLPWSWEGRTVQKYFITFTKAIFFSWFFFKIINMAIIIILLSFKLICRFEFINNKLMKITNVSDFFTLKVYKYIQYFHSKD